MNCGLALGADYGTAIVDGRNADRVHLRERPSTTSKSLGLYFTGTEVLCQSALSEEWVMITVGSQSGYMKAEFLVSEIGQSTVIPKQPTGFIHNPVDNEWVELRGAPAFDAQAIGAFNHGTVVTILGETDTHWYYVRVGGFSGYMTSDRILMSDSISPYNPVKPMPWTGPINANVGIDYYPIHSKHYTKAGNYLELDLLLPRLAGNYAGILAINDFFAEKEQFFYNELPFDTAAEAEANGQSIMGAKSGYYRSASYTLTAVLGDIVSFSAELDGGAGGVGWAGIEGNTFDLKTGKRLALSDIFITNQENYMDVIFDLVSKRITDEISTAFRTGYESPYFFENAYSGQGYESIRTFNPEDFYLTNDALVVFYPKYALAMGAAGALMFEIPYDSIQGILRF